MKTIIGLGILMLFAFGCMGIGENDSGKHYFCPGGNLPVTDLDGTQWCTMFLCSDGNGILVSSAGLCPEGTEIQELRFEAVGQVQ